MLPSGTFLFGVGEFLADLVVRVFPEHEAARRCVGFHGGDNGFRCLCRVAGLLA